jgi:hypothetical protein
LPEAFRRITQPANYPVEFTARLKALRQQIEKKVIDGR